MLDFLGENKNVKVSVKSDDEENKSLKMLRNKLIEKAFFFAKKRSDFNV